MGRCLSFWSLSWPPTPFFFRRYILKTSLRFKSFLGHSEIWVRSWNWTIPPRVRVIRSNDNGIQEQGWGGQYFMRRPACSGQVYRCPRGSLGVPIWAAACRRFGLFGGICDSANSGNSPLLGRGSVEQRVRKGVQSNPVEGSATDPLIGSWSLGTRVLRVWRSKWRARILIGYIDFL